MLNTSSVVPSARVIELSNLPNSSTIRGLMNE